MKSFLLLLISFFFASMCILAVVSSAQQHGGGQQGGGGQYGGGQQGGGGQYGGGHGHGAQDEKEEKIDPQVLREANDPSKTDEGGPSQLRAPFSLPQQQLLDTNEYFTTIEIAIWDGLRCGACKAAVRERLVPALSGVNVRFGLRDSTGLDDENSHFLESYSGEEEQQKNSNGYNRNPVAHLQSHGDDGDHGERQKPVACPDYGMDFEELQYFCKELASHYFPLCMDDLQRGCPAVQEAVDKRKEAKIDADQQLTNHDAQQICVSMGMCKPLVRR